MFCLINDLNIRWLRFVYKLYVWLSVPSHSFLSVDSVYLSTPGPFLPPPSLSTSFSVSKPFFPFFRLLLCISHSLIPSSTLCLCLSNSLSLWLAFGLSLFISSSFSPFPIPFPLLSPSLALLSHYHSLSLSLSATFSPLQHLLDSKYAVPFRNILIRYTHQGLNSKPIKIYHFHCLF